jgi:hypothetical protein
LITFAFLIVGFFFKTTDRWMRFCKWAFIITLVFSLEEISHLYFRYSFYNNSSARCMVPIWKLYFI